MNRTLRDFSLCLVALATCLIPGNSGDDKPDSAPFKRLKLDADDLLYFMNLDIYKFQLELPKGQKIRIVIQEKESAEAKPVEHWSHEFECTRDAPVVLRIGFLPKDRRMHGVLLSDEDSMELRLDLDGCNPSGGAGMIPVPLAQIQVSRRMVVVHEDPGGSFERLKTNPDTIELVSMFSTENRPPAQVNMPGYPRAALLVEKVK